MTGERSLVLWERHDGRDHHSTALSLRSDGTVSIDSFDHGPMAESMRGGDYERHVRVGPADLPALCFALLAERLAGEGMALRMLADLCRQRGIPFEEGGWN